ncbi:MAG: hypothetical protein Q9219_005301 [cf. Caloplaca sp. 3 TL-2023]
MENGIPLCSNCHYYYDEDIPSWIFFPDDLEFFTKAEQSDFKQRLRAWKKKKQRLPRKPVTAEAYRDYQYESQTLLPGEEWGSYRTFIVQEFKKTGSPGSVFSKGLSNVFKAWHGDPMAALHHAFVALNYPGVLFPRGLKELSRMYTDNDEQLLRLEDLDPSPERSANEEDSDKDSEDASEGRKDTEDNNDADNHNRADYSTQHGHGQPRSEGNGSKSATRSPRRYSKRLEKRGQSDYDRGENLFVPRDEMLVMLSPSLRRPKVILQERFARAVPSKRPLSVHDEWEHGWDVTAQDRINFYKFFNGGGYRGPWNTAQKSSNSERGLPSREVTDEMIDSSGIDVMEDDEERSHMQMPPVDYV